MAAALGQNKTMRSLVLNGSSGTLFGSGLTQYSAVKQFVKYLLLGVSRNSTLEEVHLQLPCLSGFIKREFMWCYSRLTLLFFFICFSSQAATVHQQTYLYSLVFAMLLEIFLTLS